MSRFFMRKGWKYLLTAALSINQVSAAFAAAGPNQEAIDRPFNVMWLILLLVTIAVFLMMFYLDQAADIPENQETHQPG